MELASENRVALGHGVAQKRNPVVYRITCADYRFSSQKPRFSRKGLQKQPKGV